MKNYTSSLYVLGKQITYSDNESKQLIKDAKQVTHEQLKQIRDKSTLIPGQWYRITDYVCTTVQEGTQSAGHPFDILVRADAADKLNETAYATLHKGDTYFANSKLEAWELKYTIDNDTTRFAWADTENGKGVIYYMKDEWNNECPYDFKNIQYVFREGFTVKYLTYGTRIKVYRRNEAGDQTIDGTIYYSWIKTKELESGGVDLPDEYWTTTLTLSTSMDRYTISNGTITEDHNGTITSVSYENFQTFTFDDNTGDASLHKSVNNNIISEYLYSNLLSLNDIYFKTSQYLTCYSNIFGSNCYSNKFGNNCYGNTFGNDCYNNKFGNNCYGNTFGNDCYNNKFGDTCLYNTFKNYCFSNTFGNNCHDNTFRNDFKHNTFGNDCYNNTFGDNYGYTTSGGTIGYNTFGDHCSNNEFGNGCYNNEFGYSCSYNKFGNNCGYNKFGDCCDSSTFGNDCHNNTFGANANSPKSYYRNIIVENGNKNINLNYTQTTSSGNRCLNILISLGTNNTNTVKTINIDTVNQNYKTVVCTDSLGQIVTYIPGDAHHAQAVAD